MLTRITNHFKKTLKTEGKLAHTTKEGAEIIHKMPGSTKTEREMYEQFIILRKYDGKLSKGEKLEYLLNKVNPVGGRYNLKNPIEREKFMEEAIEIAKKYNLPTSF